MLEKKNNNLHLKIISALSCTVISIRFRSIDFFRRVFMFILLSGLFGNTSYIIIRKEHTLIETGKSSFQKKKIKNKDKFIFGANKQPLG